MAESFVRMAGLPPALEPTASRDPKAHRERRRWPPPMGW